MSRIQLMEPDLTDVGPSTFDHHGRLTYLLYEWRLMLRTETIAADALAGVAVALVALPLSLAIATASGVEPVVGLVTAIVGGIVVAFSVAAGSRFRGLPPP